MTRDKQSEESAVIVDRKSSTDGTNRATMGTTVASDDVVAVSSSSSAKSEPPKFVRREKRMSGGEAGSTTTRRGDIIAQQQQQRRSRRQSGDLPDAVGSLSGERRPDSGDEYRYDGSDEMTTTDSDERSPTSLVAPISLHVDNQQSAMAKDHKGTKEEQEAPMTKTSGGPDDDDDTGPVKDYTYMYKAQLTADKGDASQMTSSGAVKLLPTSSSKTSEQVNNYDAKSSSGRMSPTKTSLSPPVLNLATSGDVRSSSSSPVVTVADDISSVTTSIVDYVRRSMSEAGVVDRTTDDSPPPLPVKASQQIAARPSVGCRESPVIDRGGDELITSNAWEPTHMSWDEVLSEAQMLGIPLFRPRSSATQSDSGRRSSLSSISSTMSHQSTPTSSPARHAHNVGGGGGGRQASTIAPDGTGQFKTVKRGSSTPGSIGDGGGSNRRESSKLATMTTTRTGKFNLKNLLAKLAGGRLKDSTSPEHHRHHHHHHHPTSASTIGLRRTTKPDDLHSDLGTRSSTLCRRSMSQPDHHKARSLSASGTGSGLRRAKINDSNTSVGSGVSQFYPSAVACRREAAAVAAGTRRSSPSSACPSVGPSSIISGGDDDSATDGQFGTSRRGQRVGGAATAPPSLHMSLRSSAASVMTADWSLPGSASSNSLGSVFSTSSHSTPWTPFSGGAASDSGIRGSSPPQCCTLSTPVHTRNNHHHVSPSHGSNRHRFANSMEHLNQCRWYWGSVGWEVAEARLTGEPDGSFLLRDSSDDRYLYSLSFCALGTVHHTRIEHYKGMFSFSAQSLRTCSGESPTTTVQLTASSIVEFIQQAMVESHRCREGQSVYTLQPKPPGLLPIPVRLLYPVSKPHEQQGASSIKAASVDATVERQSPQLHPRASHTTVSVKVDVH